jgi:hypothetical protein
MPHANRRSRAVAAAVLLCTACAAKVPWRRAAAPLPYGHADVTTVNTDYRRTTSEVLVRKVGQPTRAALDWAAYHANFMIADPAPERPPGGSVTVPPQPFAGTIEAATLTASIAQTPLTPDERAHPLAFAPLAEYLAAKQPALAAGFEEVAAAVRAESWGLPGGPAFVPQTAADALVHEPGGGAPAEIWVKIEFAPWWQGLGGLDDEDGDGAPELYGRMRADLVKPAALELVRDDYAGKRLDAAAVKLWANQLSSLWYPSYNTDLVRGATSWPAADTEPDIKRALGDRVWQAPTVVMRGKPQGKATYDVFLVDGLEPQAAAAPPARKAPPALAKTKPSPKPDAVAAAIKAELGRAPGGTWATWAAAVAPYAASVRAHLRATPAKVMGVRGEGAPDDAFLFFRRAMEMTVAGDLARQPPAKNPLPALVELKRTLDARGIDLIFVPVPTKVELFPDKLDAKNRAFAGQVVNPWARKFLLDLSEAGVEALDLWPPFLAERKKGETPEPLYQRQDTHWSSRGLRLAARLVAARVRQYPWWNELAAAPGVRYQLRDARFSRYGDIHSRLPDRDKRGLKPEELTAAQVVAPDGSFFEPDADSPIVVLGDSYTGVYELIDCQHAGVAAHLARELGRPVDLIMSYGGGPNVRKTLMRLGDNLGKKRLVVYLMSARDLYDFPDGWEKLGP